MVPYIAELSVKDLALVSDLRLELSSGLKGRRLARAIFGRAVRSLARHHQVMVGGHIQQVAAKR